MKIKLKEIIGQYLSSADQSSHQFLRLWNMAVFGLKTEFNLDITGEVITAVLDVNANKTVDLPCNYIQYLKIGVINGGGEVVTFKRNDQLSTYLSNSDTNRLEGTPTGGGSFPYVTNSWSPNSYSNYFFNGVYYNLFGADSGTPDIGQYKVDDNKRLIFLNTHTHYPQIVLEYLSDGYDEEYCDHSVDVRATQAMVSYLRWQNAIDQYKKFNPSQVKQFKMDFYNEKRKAKVRLNPFILNELRSAEAKSIKLTAKN